MKIFTTQRKNMKMMKDIGRFRVARWNGALILDSQIGLGAQVFWTHHDVGLWLWLGPFEIDLNYRHCRHSHEP